MTTYPLPTLSPIISDTGISSVAYSDIYLSLVASMQEIFGSDIYITSDSQDGQMIGIFAKAIYDAGQVAVAVYQSFSPTFSQGAGLSAIVKINGISRNTSTASTSIGDVIGVAGTVITNGVVSDSNGNLWNLPTIVTIPISGSISVAVTAQTKGIIIAPSGSINSIFNPQLGWQSFTSTADAVVGKAVEADAALKLRQKISTALPASTVMAGILSAVANVSGVSRFAGYENSTGAVDSNGLPAHSFSIVVQGGAIADIAEAIGLKKMPGAQSYGSTSYTIYDLFGLPSVINFEILDEVPIYFDIVISRLPNYDITTDLVIKSTLAAFINSLVIGEDVYVSQASAAASLISLGLGQTFYITTFQLGTTVLPSGTSNIGILFNQAATCLPANINLT